MQLKRGGFVKFAGLASLGGIVSAAGAAAADDLKAVRVLSVPSDGAKSVLYAQKANLFRKRGLQADIAPMGSGAARRAATARFRLQIRPHRQIVRCKRRAGALHPGVPRPLNC